MVLTNQRKMRFFLNIASYFDGTLFLGPFLEYEYLDCLTTNSLPLNCALWSNLQLDEMVQVKWRLHTEIKDKVLIKAAV